MEYKATNSVMEWQMGHLVERDAGHLTALMYIISTYASIIQNYQVYKFNHVQYSQLVSTFFRPNVAMAAAREAPNFLFSDAKIAKQISILQKINL